MPPHSLLLPVETLNREFDAKLLLALHAAARGWETYIGQKTTLHRRLAQFPRSVYLAKGFRAGRLRDFRMITGLGHRIVGLDEEGLVNVSDEMWLARSDSAALGYLDAIFAWGSDDARIYKLAKSLGDTPVVIAGSPRADMLRRELRGFFAADIERLHARYGNFALINTNFALVNRYVHLPTPFAIPDSVPKEKAEALKAGWLNHKQRLFEAFRALVPELAQALGSTALVIRPHPSERPEPWREAASGHPNVHVVHEGNVIPWLAAADVLIHNGCTTAVEAAVLGTPALAYRPVKQAAYDNELPNRLSEEFEDPAALASRLVELLRQNGARAHELDDGRRDLLHHHIASLEGALASERILGEIADRIGKLGRPNPLRYTSARLRLEKRRLRRLLTKPSDESARKSKLLAHQFPPTPVDEVKVRLSRMSAALGGSMTAKVRELAPNLFHISDRSR